MNETFVTRYSRMGLKKFWLISAYLWGIYVLIVLYLFWTISEKNSVGLVVCFGIPFVNYIVSTHLMRGIKYMIRDCKVVITGGNPQNIDADEIVSIECLPDVRWSWKYNPYNTVLVTSKQRVKICPEDREGLIDAVCKLNPRISVK